MQEKMRKITEGILILDSIFLIGSVKGWAPVCQKLLELKNGNMVHMKCFYTGQTLMVLALVLLVLAITNLLGKKKNWPVTICLGILMIVVTTDLPIGIGLCGNTAMACHTTAIFAIIAGIIAIGAGILETRL